MITVKSFTTIIATYTSLDDLIANFELQPWDQGYQDYDYVSEDGFVSWTKISRLKRELER